MAKYYNNHDELAEESYSNANYNQNEFVETNKTSKVNFLRFLIKEIPYEYKLKKPKIRKTQHEQIGFEIDDGHRFRNTVSITKTGTSTIQSLSSSTRHSGIRDFLKKKQIEIDIKNQFDKNFGKTADKNLTEIMPIELVNWENNVFENSNESEISVKEYVNELIDSGWEKYIYIDPKEMPVDKPFLTLYTDDPNLIFEKIEEKKIKIKKKSQKLTSYDKPLKNKYNISNDKYYTTDYKNKVSLGTFGVQHSLPALKLDLKFYKTNPTKEELRNFHRPPISIKNGTFNFKAPGSIKTTGNIIKKSHELTLADNAPFKVFEYFEESPFFVVNPGMVSLLNKYYRKMDSIDEPATEDCIVLDVEDEAPFFGFGNIKQGTYLTTLANNLFIAPVSLHNSNDFLCVIENDEIIMRPIDKIHLVGQEFPKEEVFAPHSRKLNQFCKDRLKVAAYRIFSKGKDLQMQQLDQMFPYFSEGSKRKWLKEYSDCAKRGKENVWTLKDSFSIVGEEDLRKLVTPENICQYESMLSSERRLQDLGYKCLEEDEEDDYEAYSPSWYLSRNFVNAANGKGLLELIGPADPSGTGEAFSFRKIRLKKGSDSENRKIIAEHQATYKERSAQIWNKHLEMLNSQELVEYKEAPRKVVVEQPSETTATETAACLTIKRTVEENGKIVIKTEKIYDNRIIKAYLKARKCVKIEDKKSTFTCSSCGQSGHMKTNKSCPNYVGSLKTQKKKTEDKKPSAIFQDRLSRLISVFMAIPFSNAFHRPVSLKKFPNYCNIIQRPIDLGTIKNKVKNGNYVRYEDFLSDLELMKDNCAIYNGPSHSLTEIASNIYNQALNYYESNMNEIREIEIQMQEDVKFI